ncbi:MAG: class I SAM-dependent methyltransferase [Desulfobacteraceae bacterium]|nr:class I SAM-dependent methyltransferase [Desulfobacteraceae bacterium]
MKQSTNLYESQALRAVTGPAIRPGGLALTERALALCGLTAGARVLDVGCGGGATVAHLRQSHGLRAMGLDLSWMLLAEGRAQPGCPPLVQGPAEMLPVADGKLQAIFCECVLSLLSSPKSALAEWHRALAPGGLLVVSDLYARAGQLEDELFSAPGRCCLAGAVDRDTLLEGVTGAGFEVVVFEDHSPLLKQLAAQLVWAYGSLETFRARAGLGCTSHGNGRPGYYLMVAKK